MTTLSAIAITAVVVLVVSIVVARIVANRAYRAGYQAGYDLMFREHEAYRAKNKDILNGLQNIVHLPPADGPTLDVRELPALRGLTTVLQKVDAALAWICGDHPAPQEVSAAIRLLDGPDVNAVRDYFELPRSAESRLANHFPRPHSHDAPK